MEPTHQEPAAQVRQHSLFATPISKIYELQDALKEEKSMLKDMETDYPEGLTDLIKQFNELKKQVNQEKEDFIADLSKSDEHYQEARARIAQLKVDLDNAISTTKQEIAEESKRQGNLDETLVIDGQPIRLQTLNTETVEIYIDGKEL